MCKSANSFVCDNGCDWDSCCCVMTRICEFQNIDFSLGLGWGRLGGVDHANNIFGIFDENLINQNIVSLNKKPFRILCKF